MYGSLMSVVNLAILEGRTTMTAGDSYEILTQQIFQTILDQTEVKVLTSYERTS